MACSRPQLLLALLAALALAVSGQSQQASYETCVRKGAARWLAAQGDDPSQGFYMDLSGVSKSSHTGEFYGVTRKDNVVPLTAYSETSSNGQCQATNPFEYNKEVTFTNTYEASLTQTVSMENAMEVSVGLEGLFSAKEAITFKMETSSTASQSQTSTTTDNIRHTYKVCPRTVLEAFVTMSTATITAEFDFDITYSGSVKLTSGKQAGAWHDSYPGVEALIAAGVAANEASCSGFSTAAGKAAFHGKGQVSGVHGYSVISGTHETMLPATKTECPRGLIPCKDARLLAEQPNPQRRLLARKLAA